MGILTVIRNEFKTIASSMAILLVLMGGIFMYGLLYNYMYAPDVVREVPVTVVDRSQSELSREYIRLLDATPQVKIESASVNYPDAVELMAGRQAFGILYLPDDFETRVSRGDESVFIMYQVTSAFLYYTAMQEAASSSMLALNNRYRPNMLVFLSPQEAVALTSVEPIQVVGTALYNPTDGYGTYLIPAVLIVIIFQTLLMVIAMISGEERHSGSIVRLAGQPINLSFKQMAQIVIGKSFVYGILYAVFALFLLGLVPLLFGLPDIGNPLYVVALMIPFLLATSFLGLTASAFFTDADAPLLMIAFFSVGLIFLSGVSYPLDLMPWYWRVAHFFLPVTSAVLAYVKLNSMGASMAEIQTEYLTLWIQCLVYFVTACFIYRHNIRKALRKE